jgi:hypothetical protein
VLSTVQTRIFQNRLLVGALVSALLLAAGYFFLVGTSVGHKFDDDAFFGREALNRRILRLNSDMLDRVNKGALLMAGLVVLVAAAVRRCMFVGVIAAAGFSSAVVGAEILKRILPWRPLTPDDLLLGADFQMNSYPSGHATIGTSFVLSLLLVSSSRWRHWSAIAGGCVASIFATGVLFAGWHRPSDALGALAWSGLCMSLAAAFAIRLRGRLRPLIAYSSRAAVWSLSLAVFVTGTTWLIAAAAAPGYPHSDLPFFVVTGVMNGGAFSLTAWYAWELRAVDWIN